MTYRTVRGDGLRTRWDDQPVVAIGNRRDAFGTVTLSWATEPVREGWVAQRTRVTFQGVVEYRWRYFDVDNEAAEEGGLELGEIQDSDRVTELRRQGFDHDLRHLRISFDEHGTYDVICRTFFIDYRAATRDRTEERG